MMAREQWCGERRQACRQRQAGRAGGGRTAPRVMGRAQQGSTKHQLDARTMHTFQTSMERMPSMDPVGHEGGEHSSVLRQALM